MKQTTYNLVRTTTHLYRGMSTRDYDQSTSEHLSPSPQADQDHNSQHTSTGSGSPQHPGSSQHPGSHSPTDGSHSSTTKLTVTEPKGKGKATSTPPASPAAEHHDPNR